MGLLRIEKSKVPCVEQSLIRCDPIRGDWRRPTQHSNGGKNASNTVFFVWRWVEIERWVRVRQCPLNLNWMDSYMEGINDGPITNGENHVLGANSYHDLHDRSYCI